ncbi:hypothetical protein PSN45_001842 [Yamadazyma tenuis]|uniref:Uncharacterized protein n=1 Tax=Candida tenuis (strain ATCC 10573 / BCRC 21748 / CBS 615 / JCM 9827 / NBRC 10315 / NRRL Y-1498 / VKM Y-70) TaxID=590646 RepID=G3BDW1_CANTC|nr:uncharacterized protein CANTEDRAFT_116447 [Yamadazyma tenuis ATCC 10573]XP_006690339.1 uncharacterized protein CANTEDRAFT_116447 [Yamadazyma tenuis ATCC 10573]EGV61124.1 hypothetical protein CANTEDRAFT_116447 [Yamadazyma tenuis ATCC 10573]EGV61125.1 hypothetical protein CANTEDRAFT_116447 [Yamadazyma tenuis ATCC 10573]WEJ94358.1 hypothetical protein PSN45_001842 [Yamadazyma tenuis]
MYKSGVKALVRNASKRRPGLSQLRAQRDTFKPPQSVASSSTSSPPLKYVSVKEFPKAPSHVTSMDTKDLFESVNISIEPEKEDLSVNFEIPRKFSKQYQSSILNQRDLAMMKQLDVMMNTDDDKVIMESQIILGNLYSDRDSFSSYIPEHPLKKSLSGMINLNPHLNDIDDEYLWDLIPPDKFFGSKFYEKEGTFKEWEKEVMEEKNKLIDHLKVHEAEISDFLQKYGKNKSFLEKRNGRLRLNKSLIKAYKLLKSKNLHVKKMDGNDGEDLEFEFVIDDFDIKDNKN